jgi:integrase
MPRSPKPEKYGNKWRIRWIDADGNRHAEYFSSYSNAERALHKYHVEVEQIRLGLKGRIEEKKFFSELADYWIRNRTIRKRTPKDDISIIKAHLLPEFGNLLLSDISVKHIDEFKKRRSHLSPQTIRNQLTLLIAMLNLAIELGWIKSKPKIKKPKVEHKDFHYLRTEEEIRRLLDAALEEPPCVFQMYATAIYTGMRAGELCGLKWDDIDLERRLITVQRSFNRPTKTAHVRYVPILEPLLPVLKEWRLKNPCELVFPNQIGTMQLHSSRITQEILKRNR